jgi:3-methylfumaryl-CoA hydratase
MPTHEELQQYVGRKMEFEDLITATQVQKLNVTLDRSEPVPKSGDPVPPLWHHIFFPNLPLTCELKRDGMVPEIDNGPADPLPLRMFAGSRAAFHRSLRVGEQARQVRELASIAAKEGRSGKLVFATYRNTISTSAGVATVDDWDIVFREPPRDGVPPPPGQPAPQGAVWKRTINPTHVMLYRFSAVGFNPHRIHYDHPYTTRTEGYPELIVHGPLTAICLADLARDHNPGATMTAFEMRAKAPLYANQPFQVMGRPRDGGKACDLWALTPENTVAMDASATFA